MNVYSLTKNWLEVEHIALSAEAVTTSTNETAKSEAFNVSESLKIYLADQQSAGRGRGSNTWTNTKPGDALMLTLSLHVDSAPQPITAPLMGLALYRSLKETWPTANLALKAPNDILLEGKKVCGILAETVQMRNQHRLLVGLGMNVFSAPENILNAGYFSARLSVNESNWCEFLANLVMQFQWAARGSQASELGEDDRSQLLRALNQNPHLEKNYVSLTPAGDLVTDAETLSWRSL
jgi:BirA family transcriptional regulator, biotin operon repressor / biotin---[acetyl-CoA-carboxylase] ligase